MTPPHTPAPWAPRLPPHAEADPWPYGALESGENYRLLNLEDLAWRAADGVSFAQVRIVRAPLDGLRLRRWVLDDVLLKEVSLAGADWTDASGDRLRLEQCRLTGLKMPRAKFKRIVFAECQGKYLMAEGLVLVDARIQGGSYVEANFDDADLRGVIFDGCDLTNASFLGAKLEGADFRLANVEQARLQLADLKGAILAPHQALSLFQTHSGAVLSEG